jgi:hypothetical protein
VDLRLDDPDAAAEFLRRLLGLAHGEGGVAARHRHAVRAQQFLGLVFVDVHPSEPEPVDGLAQLADRP